MEAAIVLAFVVGRISLVWGKPIARFADTPGYLTLDFSGSATRLWPVPLLYQVVTSDTARVAVHVGLGILAWLWLAAEVRLLVPSLRRCAPVAILVLGATPQVGRWDLAILSESVGLSIAVATYACWIHAVRTRTTAAWVAASCLTVLFGMTRTAQVPIMILVAVIAVVAARRARLHQTLKVVAPVFAVGCIASLLMLSNNHGVSTLNLYTVLSERVLGDPAASSWFAANGMPWNDTFHEARGYVYREDLPADLLQYLDVPADQAPPQLMAVGGMDVAQWARNNGWQTYLRHLASDPYNTITSGARQFDPLLDPTDATLLPLELRPIIPRSIFGPWATWLGAACFAAAATIRRCRFDTRLAVPCVALLCGVPWFCINVYASGIEHPRHAITLAVVLRISCLIAIAVGWERLVATPNKQARHTLWHHDAITVEMNELAAQPEPSTQQFDQLRATPHCADRPGDGRSPRAAQGR